MDTDILSGSLKSVTVPDLLTFISMIRKTGTLSLVSSDRVRKIFWEKGDMIFAGSSEPEESLGAFLIRHGKITQEQNMKAGLHVKPGMRQGKVLVKMGALTPKELWWAVKSQVLEIIYGTFSLMDGLFTFRETDEPNDEKITLSTTTTNIIMEGIRRLDEWPRIRELIPSDRLILYQAPPETRDKSVNFLEGEKAILGLIDGNRDVREIIYESEFEEFETLRILMSLIMAKYVLMPQAQKAKSPEEVEDSSALEELVVNYNRVFSRIFETLSGHLDTGMIRNISEGAMSVAKNGALDGVSFDDQGCLNPKVLFANVADLPNHERFLALDSILSALLSSILFESSKHLGSEEKSAIYRMAGERLNPAGSS